jgi:alpha-methylacyl-CoA racemase
VQLPLTNLKVVDFTNLLPGPLCTLMLAEAGADVMKIERPGSGDEMREQGPKIDGLSVPFLQLNRGKRSLAKDLKNPRDRDAVIALIKEADVVVEQFRPGVMRRLGLDYDSLKTVNDRLIYCSITGYGQTGPDANKPGHDINYLAEMGMLSLTADPKPSMPLAPVADIAGGSYPALINILLAVLNRQTTGRGCYIDISMAHSLIPLMYGAYARTVVGVEQTNEDLGYMGGSPRYQLYQTADGRYLAIGAYEEKFWSQFCKITGLSTTATYEEVQERIAREPSDAWRIKFAGKDVCCSIVATAAEAYASGFWRASKSTVSSQRVAVPALVIPIVEALRSMEGVSSAP